MIKGHNKQMALQPLRPGMVRKNLTVEKLKIDDIKFFLGFSSESKKKSNIHINFVVGKDGKVILKN